MGVVDKLLKEAEASERRLSAARAAIASLTRAERERLLLEIVRDLEKPEVERSPQAQPQSDAEAVETSYVDACEAALAKHPAGLTSAEIGVAIGQDRQRADSTVRWLQRSRGNVGRQGDKWVLLRSSTKPVTNRDLIKRVLAEAGKPLRAGEIIAGVLKFNPNANENTLHAELMRLRRDLNEIVRMPGSTPNGGVYTLASAERGAAK